MNEIRKNPTSSDILRQGIKNTEDQTKKLFQQAESINDPQLKKYLESVGKALNHANDLDKVVLSKIEGIAAPSGSKIGSLLKKLFKML